MGYARAGSSPAFGTTYLPYNNRGLPILVAPCFFYARSAVSILPVSLLIFSLKIKVRVSIGWSVQHKTCRIHGGNAVARAGIQKEQVQQVEVRFKDRKTGGCPNIPWTIDCSPCPEMVYWRRSRLLRMALSLVTGDRFIR